MGRKKYKNLDYDYIVSSVAGYAKVAPIARKVKAGDDMAIAKAAAMMTAAVRNVMPKDKQVVLVPIPNRTGRAGYTKTLAEKISEALHLPVIDALASNTHEPLYLVKKANGSIDEVPLYFYRIRRVPRDKIPILIDNVLDTGHTAMSAYEAIGRQDTLMAVLGDTHKFTPNQWKSDIYPLIDNNMASKKKEEVPQQATPKEEPKAQTEKKAAKKTAKLPKSKTLAELYENMKEKHPDAVLLFRTGDFYTALNADASKVNPADWFYVAQLNGKQLNPMKMDAVDIAAYQKREAKVEDMMQKYYPTKLAPKVSVEEYKAANILSDGRVIDKMTVYKEKD